VAALTRYVGDGGSLLFLLDRSTPVALDFPLLDQLLGLRRRKGVVCMPPAQFGNLFVDPFLVNTKSYGFDSPIVEPLRAKELTSQFYECQALAPLGDPDHSDLEIKALVWSPAPAWLDLEDADGEFNRRHDPATETAPGEPLALAYSVVLPGGGRAVVVGDSDFLDHDHLDTLPGNRPLGLGMVNWLVQREKLISLGTQPYDVVQVDLTPDEYETILLYVVVAIPVLALLAALVVAWTRRN